MRDSAAARDLLYRRARSLANYENANKNLDKARAKNKDVLAAENAQQVSSTFTNVHPLDFHHIYT